MANGNKFSQFLPKGVTMEGESAPLGDNKFAQFLPKETGERAPTLAERATSFIKQVPRPPLTPGEARSTVARLPERTVPGIGMRIVEDIRRFSPEAERAAQTLREDIPSRLAEEGKPIRAGLLGSIAELTPITAGEVAATIGLGGLAGPGTRLLARKFPKAAEFLTKPKLVRQETPRPVPPAPKEELPLFPQRPTQRQQILAKQRKFVDEPENFKIYDTPQTITARVSPAVSATPVPVIVPPQGLPPKEVIPQVKVAGVTQPRITVDSAKAVVEGGERLAQRNPDFFAEGGDQVRLFKKIGQALREKAITIDDLSPKWREFGWSNEEVAALYEEGVTQGAQIMNQLSQFARRLNAVSKNRITNLPEPELTAWNRISALGKEGVNIWRASLVSQLATAMRNLIVGGFRVGLNVLDDAALGAVESVTGRRAPQTAFAPLMEDIMAIGRRFTPKGRKQLNEILKNEPLLAPRLHTDPIAGMSFSSKYAKMLSIFNRSQEYFIRDMVFDARVTALLRRRGIDPNVTKNIPKDILEAGLNDALEMTFAKAPTSDLARRFVKAFNIFYPLEVVAYPFPRYLTNAMRTIYEFSPLQPMTNALRMIAPKQRKMILDLPFRRKMQMINRATMGAGMFTTAAYVRNSKFAGEKWYEFRPFPDSNPDKVWDIRPFGPIIPVYFFLAEFMKQEAEGRNRFTIRDYIEGTLGINRMAGTTLFVTSFLAGQTPEQGFEALKKMSGEFLGGFGNQFATYKDFVAGMSGDETIIKDTRQEVLTGALRQKIPFAGRGLPEKRVATRAGAIRRESPILRQLTGVSLRTKNALEREIDRLGLLPQQINPRTGIAELDNEIRGRMGEIVEEQGGLGEFILSDDYGNLTDVGKKEELLNEMQFARREATREILDERPDLLDELSKKRAGRELLQLISTGTDQEIEELSPRRLKLLEAAREAIER